MRADGQVDASLGPEWPLFNHALADSISSLPPRGLKGNGPSTYWIDVAEEGVRKAAAAGDGSPFTWGNITQLSVRGDYVVASYDFDEEQAEEVPLNDFLALLRDWRVAVLRSAEKATSPLPETYRRNPKGPLPN